MKKVILAIVALCLSATSYAVESTPDKTSAEPLNIPRVTDAPVIDGELDDAIWQQATRVSLGYNTWPQDSTPAEVETFGYIAEDGEFLYIAFDARDPNPELIRASYRKRDRMFQDDFVGVILDTFNDERRAYEFFVNPLGAQGDLTLDDVNNNEDENWDTIWETAGKITDKGYQVEVAIPFRNLRYKADLAEQIWGVEFLRIYPRDARNSFVTTKRDRALNCSLCQFNKMKGMPNLSSKTTNLEFTPTVTYINNETRDIDPIAPWETVADEADFGLDMRWAITEDWILNTTINPDFSQVEVDGAQLDVNNTFALFFPERRPFFLEGADYFNTNNNRLVYTRTIADPDAGTKLTGKSDGYRVGLIAARDTTTNILIPSSQGSYIEALDNLSTNVLIGRVQKDIGDRSTAGVLVTSRSGDDYSNTVTSVDGNYYIDDHNLIRYQFTYTETENPDAIRFNDGDPDPILAKDQSDTSTFLDYRHIQENYLLRLTYQDMGEDFRADSGFINQVDYTRFIAGGNYSWFGDKGSDWTRFRLSGDWDRTEDQSGQLLEEELEMYFSINGPMQFFTNVGALSRDRFYDGQIFKEQWLSNYAEISPSKNVTFENFIRKGDMIDFNNSRLGEGFNWNIWFSLTAGQHFSMTANRRLYTLDVDGGELFEAIVYDVRLAYQFNQRNRLSLTLQHTDIERNVDLYNANLDNDPDNDIGATFRDLSTQLLYTYQLNAKTQLFLGYSDAGFENDIIDRIEKTNRTLFAKFSYHMQW